MTKVLRLKKSIRFAFAALVTSPIRTIGWLFLGLVAFFAIPVHWVYEDDYGLISNYKGLFRDMCEGIAKAWTIKD
jgi:hypothetical protein